jgi:hypothetical protein
MRTARIAAAVGLAAALGSGLIAASATTNGAPTGGHTGSQQAAGFAHPKQNPYYPLRPGTISHLRGGEEDSGCTSG